MKTGRPAWLAILPVLLMNPGTLVAEELALPEIDPRGAVLCHWMIYTTVYSIGQKCKPKRDHEFLSFLSNEMDRIDAFIVRNSATTKAMLSQQRRNEAAMLSTEPGLCDPNDELKQAFYLPFRNRDRALMTADLDELLKVDRKPVMNPYL